MDKSSFCALPFSGLFLGSDGGLRPCCSLRGDLGNVNKNTVEEILYGDIATSIRRSIINNEKHPMCSQCYELESRGARTERTGTIHKMEHFKNYDENKFILEKLDLRWSNTCNLTCNYCYEYFSSKWAEIKGIKINANKEDNESKIFSFIEDNLEHLNNINLLGGEPLLQKPNVRLLSTIPKNVPIYILTNLTVPLDKNKVALELLPNKNVSWGISFETIEKKFEYVRHGGSWNQLLDNLRMLNHEKVTHIDIHPLYCLYSAFNMLEFYDFIESEGYFTSIYWQVLQNEPGLDVFKLPFSLKVKAIDELEKVFSKYETKYDMKLLRNIYTNLKDSLHDTYYEGYPVINFLNKLESHIPGKLQGFKNLWPELYINVISNKYHVTTTIGTFTDSNGIPIYSSERMQIE